MVGSCQEQLARALQGLSPVAGESQLHPRDGLEDIFAIARRFGVSASALYNANGGELPTGDELLLIPTEYVAPLPRAEGIVVNLTERNVYFYRNGRPVGRFPTAIGMRGWETPTGEFTVANKVKNPTWFPPDWAVAEEPVPAGPDNPLGDRWMGLSAKGYGIHATNAPASVGLYGSHGCMRMYPEHAHDLFQLVRVGAPVRIIYQRVVLGYDAKRGVVHMAFHPDPYRFGEVRAEHVREQLQEHGLEKVADMAAVTRALERPNGLPTPILGSPARVLVNGRPLRLALGPTPVAGDWLVPAGPLVESLGGKTEVGPGAGYIVVTRGADRIFFSPGDPEAIVNGELVALPAAARLAAGYPLIPVKATAAVFGASVGWDSVRDAVLVWDGGGLGKVSAPEARLRTASTKSPLQLTLEQRLSRAFGRLPTRGRGASGRGA
jgi:L,D-transpeptidase ErfK/SrfK